MIRRDEALNRAKTMTPRRDSLGAFIKELTLRGLFDTPVQSKDVIRAVRDQFGRRFPVSYVPTYMKPFLSAGILRSHDSIEGRGNSWAGAWLIESESSSKSSGDRLRLKVDTTAWESEVAEDFQLGLSCYSNNLWKPAAVMVRRAYEGALVMKHRSVEGRDPEKMVTCHKCLIKLGNRPLSITDLHFWVASVGLVREKMEGLSILLKDLGAGGAHPTKTTVVDPETAEIIIKCGAVLLRDIYNPKRRIASHSSEAIGTHIPEQTVATTDRTHQ